MENAFNGVAVSSDAESGWRPHIALSSPDERHSTHDEASMRGASSKSYSDFSHAFSRESLDPMEMNDVMGDNWNMDSQKDQRLSMSVNTSRYLRSKPRRANAKSRVKSLFFSLAWILLLFVTPLWMYGVNSIEIYGFNVTHSLNDIRMDKLPEIKQCAQCVNGSETNGPVTFTVEFSSNLTAKPMYASSPIVFVTNSFKGEWWVAAISNEYVYSANQTWVIPGKYCFGPAGAIYMVACLPREGFNFRPYDKVFPPFDDRCFALGSRCGVSCSGFQQFPHFCDPDLPHDGHNGIIPMKYLVNQRVFNCTVDPLSNDTNNCTYVPSKFMHGKGVWAFVFYFFSFFSLINYLLNHSAPVFGWLDQLTEEVEPEFLPVKKNRVVVGVASIFCSEKVFHMIRNIFGVVNSWAQLNVELDKIRYARKEFVHYILDNSLPLGKADGGKEFKSYLPHFISLMIPRIEGLNADEIDKISFALRAAPFQCSEAEYEEYLPHNLRETIDYFLQTVPTHCRGPYTPVDSFHFQTLPHKFNAELDDSIKVNIANHKCCNGKCDYDKCVFTLRLNFAQPLTVKFVVLSARTPNAKGKSVSLQHIATVMRHDHLKKKAASFLALMDARHMMTPPFWTHTITHFFNSLGYEITSLRWIQVMQYFSGLENTNDYFDRGNFFNYLYNNALRDKIKSTTSCGTNALWSMREHRIRHGQDDFEFEPFQFQDKTKIEDTETSHVCLRLNEDSIYVAKPLVYGSVKDPVEYGEAPSRWAAGAMQLFWVEVKQSPWILIWTIFLFIIAPTGLAFIVYFVSNGHYILLALDILIFFMLLMIAVSKTGKPVGRYIVRLVNVTYWMTGPLSAVFWMDLMPCLLLVCPYVPFRLNTQLMVLGGLVVAVLQWVITSVTKSWAKTKEVHLWRSQQAWYALWPLVIAGIPSLFSTSKTWSVSSSQALFTLIFNCIQMAALTASCVYGVYSLTQIITVSKLDQILVSDKEDNVMGQRIVGLVLSMFSFLLIYPITISLLMSQFGSKSTSILDVSMRHFTLLFMILLVVIIYAFNFDKWRWEAFTSFATLGFPGLELDRW